MQVRPPPVQALEANSAQTAEHQCQNKLSSVLNVVLSCKWKEKFNTLVHQVLFCSNFYVFDILHHLT